MPDTIRQYVLDLLVDMGELTMARNRDSPPEYARRAEHLLDSGEQLDGFAQLEREYENLRAAMDWARTSGDFEAEQCISGAMWWVWVHRGYYGEGLERLKQILFGRGAQRRSHDRAKLLHAAGVMYYTLTILRRPYRFLKRRLKLGSKQETVTWWPSVAWEAL